MSTDDRLVGLWEGHLEDGAADGLEVITTMYQFSKDERRACRTACGHPGHQIIQSNLFILTEKDGTCNERGWVVNFNNN